MIKAILLLAATLGVTGCGGSMMSDADEMRSMVDDARLENDAHLATIEAAVSLDQMREEMTRHDGAMDGMMNMMSDAMGAMSHCSGPGMQELRGMHDGMRGEMNEHASAMDQAANLDAAAGEVTRHASAMHTMFDRMDVASGRMGCM